MTIYLPRHDTQYEPRTWSSGLDCNMNAAADAARYASLGLKDHTHDFYRHLSGDTIGGTTIDQAHQVLDDVGVAATAWDGADGKTWADVIAALRVGPIIAHGNYGSVPVALRGSKTFTGHHSVLFHSRNTTTGVIRVGDGLCEEWTLWPGPVASDYMVAFPGPGLTYLTLQVRRACAKVPRANVRADHTRASRIIGTLTPRSRVHCGGAVKGERIGSNATWLKVWVGGHAGYCHTSVARYV